MKMSKLKLPLMLVAAVLLQAGCSTLAPDERYAIDYEYVNKVERASRSVSNNRIYWINPPQKKVLQEELPDASL